MSCAPCTKHTGRKKQRKQIAGDIRDRDALELDTPDVYRQPLAYRTNDFWAEEIRSGPGPPPRNVTRKQRESRRQAKRIKEMEERARVGVVTKPSVGVADSENKSTVDGVKIMLRQALPTTERWRRNQREDEELWGSPSYESRPDSRQGPIRKASNGGSSVGFPGLAPSQASTEDFYHGRNPPINDLHPPVVSNPSVNKTGNKWMLQPPPTSDVMNGFVSPDGRSRSGTAASAGSWRRGGDVRLDRQISQKVIEDKLSRGEFITLPTSPARSERLRNLYEKKEPGSSSSMATKNKRSAADPSSSSSSIIVPGTSDSGVDVTLPHQTWPNPSTCVQGTAQQDFAFPIVTDGDTTQQSTWSSPGAGEDKFYKIPILSQPIASTPRTSQATTVISAAQAAKDTPRGTVSASASPLRARQRRFDSRNPQYPFSTNPPTSIKEVRTRERVFSLPYQYSEADQDMVSIEPRQHSRQTPRRHKLESAKRSQGNVPMEEGLVDADAGADADSEDEDGYDDSADEDYERRRRDAAAAVADGAVGTRWGRGRGRDGIGKTWNFERGRRRGEGGRVVDSTAGKTMVDVGNEKENENENENRSYDENAEVENETTSYHKQHRPTPHNHQQDPPQKQQRHEKPNHEMHRMMDGRELLLRRWSVDF